MDRQRMMVQVDGVAINMKRTKGDDDGEQAGGLTPVNGSIHYSNVNLVDPETGLPTKISYGFLEDGSKVRVSKKSGSIIHKPAREDKKYVNRTKNIPQGPLDTPADRVVEVTYMGEDFDAIREDFGRFVSEKERIEDLLVFKL